MALLSKLFFLGWLIILEKLLLNSECSRSWLEFFLEKVLGFELGLFDEIEGVTFNIFWLYLISVGEFVSG